MQRKAGFHNLKVVDETKELIKMVYQVSELFPKSEMFGLTSQLRRAAVSVLLNIVEGQRRKSDKDFYRFLDISDASLAELEVGLEIARELGFLKNGDYELVEQQRKIVAVMLVSLIKTIKRSL